MLEMKAQCERCQQSLASNSSGALICSHGCTFCAACAEELNHVCPNCGGELVTRPRRSTEQPRTP